MTSRVAWTAVAVVVLCTAGAAVFWSVSKGHGLVHAAESGNVERVLAELANAPNDAELWELLGEAYSRRADYARAASAYKRAIQLDPTDETYWWMLGIAEVCIQSPDGVAWAEGGLRRLNGASAAEFRDLAPHGCCAFGGCEGGERRRRTRR